MSICYSGINSKSHSVVVTLKPREDHPLIKLARVIPWEEIAKMVTPDLRESTIKKLLNIGRKLRLRIHLGVYLLQQMFDLTDRQTEWQLKDNAAYQIFCGFGVVDGWHAPDHTKIEEFRSRLSPETQGQIANLLASLGVKLGFGDATKMDQDSTVQEAGITYPSDARLLVKIAILCQKVYNFLLDKFPEEGLERFNLKRIKAVARTYFFSKKADIEHKRAVFKDLFYTVFLECCKATQLSLAKRHVEALPWNIRRAWEQINAHAKKYFHDVEQYVFTSKMVQGKIMSFHLSMVACFNKMKEGKKLQFGRQFQLGRIGGNFMIVAPCGDVRMEDKRSVVPMIAEHERLFGSATLRSYGTDKGYFSHANMRHLANTKAIAEVNLQRPGLDLSFLPEEEQAVRTALTNRRSGIEPLIGHIKHGGQLGRSRMKKDQSTLASGYSAVAGFNLRQIVRHQLGKEIATM